MASKLYYYHGTMGSSKTLRLLTTAHNFEERGIAFLVLKPAIDNREASNIVASRVGLQRECIPIEKDQDIYQSIQDTINVLRANLDTLEWILVDECQFLSVEQIDQLAKVVDNLNVNVMCFGLRTDFRTKSFPASRRLFELADNIEEIKSRCACGRKTIVNVRMNAEGEIITDGPQIMVGGDETYQSLCRKCYHRLLNQQK